MVRAAPPQKHATRARGHTRARVATNACFALELGRKMEHAPANTDFVFLLRSRASLEQLLLTLFVATQIRLQLFYSLPQPILDR